MSRTVVHLLRHGEVDNPAGVLYGCMPGFHLSPGGRQMAVAAADSLAGRDVTYLAASPLERAQETAQPFAERFQLPVHTDQRLLEAGNVFQGRHFSGTAGILRQPQMWSKLRNPLTPSWGEPYLEIAARMLAATEAAREAAEGHEAVCVSHQLPIWTMRRRLQHRPLPHHPQHRQCGLASLTSITFDGDRVAGIDYGEPAAHLVAPAARTKASGA